MVEKEGSGRPIMDTLRPDFNTETAVPYPQRRIQDGTDWEASHLE